MPDYTLIRARRKTVSLRVAKDLRVVVRAPLGYPTALVDSFVKSHAAWIETQKARIQAHKTNQPTPEEAEALTIRAKAYLPARAAHFAALLGVAPTGLRITQAATRWGSCSARNSLCFSYRVMLLPPDLIDCIIVHELAHIRVKNHSAAFYREMERVMPDAKARHRCIREWHRNANAGDQRSPLQAPNPPKEEPI